MLSEIAAPVYQFVGQVWRIMLKCDVNCNHLLQVFWLFCKLEITYVYQTVSHNKKRM